MEDEVLVDLYRSGVHGDGTNGNGTGSANGGAELVLRTRHPPKSAATAERGSSQCGLW